MAAAKGKGAAEDKPLSSPTISSSNNPFIFWFYFTASVALITTLFIPISSLFFSSSADEERSWFLALPDDLRHHYSSGRTVKVEVGASRSPAEVFAVEYGPRDGSETVVLIHGFGSSSFSFRRLLPALAAKGLRAVAIDLPGSGFSDKYVDVEEEVESPGGIWGVYYDIKEKGLFWGFDQLIETGQIPFNGEEAIHVHKRKVRKSIVGDEAELSRVIRQVVDSLRLAPVHLVLHDTGVVPGAVWAAAEDRGGAVRSVTVVDGAAAPALPMWAVEVPVVREMVLGVPIFYFGLLRWCCSRSIDWAAAEAHRVLLKGKGGRSAAVAVGRSLNASFELREWARSEKVRNFCLFR